MVRHGISFICSILILIPPPSSGQNSEGAALIEFMTNTPPLESIVFSERMGHKAADGTVTHRYVTYEGKLEGKNFYLRQISDVSGIGSPLRGDESFFCRIQRGAALDGQRGMDHEMARG